MQRPRLPQLPHLEERRSPTRTLILSMCVPALLAVLAGCTTTPDHSTPPAATSTAIIPTPHWTDPPNRPGEITRSIFDINKSNFTAQVDGPLKAGDLAIQASCTAQDDAEMTYTLQGAGGTVFGPPGRIRCNRPAETTSFSSEGVPAGELVQVLLDAGPKVTKGYAILLRP